MARHQLDHQGKAPRPALHPDCGPCTSSRVRARTNPNWNGSALCPRNRTSTASACRHSTYSTCLSPEKIRRRRDIASGRPSIDLNRLKPEIDLRREFTARASRTASPPGRVAPTVDELATRLAGCVLMAAAEIAPGAKRREGPTGWYGIEEVQRDINAATTRREAARRRLRGAPLDPNPEGGEGGGGISPPAKDCR